MSASDAEHATGGVGPRARPRQAAGNPRPVSGRGLPSWPDSGDPKPYTLTAQPYTRETLTAKPYIRPLQGHLAHKKRPSLGAYRHVRERR